MEITSRLAQFVAATEFEDIPRQAIDEAKKLILDCLGVMLAGSLEEPARIVADYAKESGGNPRASVVGAKFMTSPELAAMANGTAAHALDFDDTSWTMTGHPSASMLPAVLAIAEQTGASGKDVLLAYILALEVAGKIGSGINPSHYETGWHATITLGTLGAAAAVAKLMRLSEAEIAAAFGIAASEASGLRQNFGTMTKPLHAGFAARNGVLAAGLARRGLTADRAILESRFGFFNVLGGSKFDPVKIAGHLGDPFDVVAPGVSLKQYPSCYGTHWALDAAIGLVRHHDVVRAEVESIECVLPSLFAQMLIHADPQTGLEGKFSMQFCMAVAVTDRCAGLRQFTDAKVQSQEIRELMKKVKMIVDEGDATKSNPNQVGFSTVTLRLRNGSTLTRSVDVPRGMPESPLTMDEIIAKYRDCAGFVLSDQEVDKPLELVAGLDGLADTSELMSLLRGN